MQRSLVASRSPRAGATLAPWCCFHPRANHGSVMNKAAPAGKPTVVFVGLVLPRPEFLAPLVQQMQGADAKVTESQLNQVFEHYDKDGNGRLSMAELHALWRDVSQLSSDESLSTEVLATTVAKSFAIMDAGVSLACIISRIQTLMLGWCRP